MMANETTRPKPRVRYGDAFWRTHHEAWKHSSLNQREYCEAQGIPLKAFGNWRAKFKAEPRPPVPMLLYWRGGLSHALSQGLSHDLRALLSHLRARGRRREFGERMNGKYRRKRLLPGARFSEIARRYGIAERVLFRWKQLTVTVLAFVSVEIGAIGDIPPPAGLVRSQRRLNTAHCTNLDL